jgi:DNA-binding PadR family transcriptional regulator
MNQSGLLASRWEDPAAPEVEGRPPRRLYRITAAGEAAFKQLAADASGPRLRPGVEPA